MRILHANDRRKKEEMRDERNAFFTNICSAITHNEHDNDER